METKTNPNDELLSCFDEQGNLTEPKPRSLVCRDGTRQWHAVANIWLVNKQGQILCTRRALHLSGNPGKWQSYLGGHVKAGSSFLKTALAELEEEVGLAVRESGLVLIDKGKYEPWMHFYENYAYLFNSDISQLIFNDGEIIGAKWYNMDEYNKELLSHPENWCNSCTLSNQLKIKQWLEKIC